MATVTSVRREPVFTLSLNEAEAKYLYSALFLVNPTSEAGFEDDEDPVYGPLGAALREAGVDTYALLNKYAKVNR